MTMDLIRNASSRRQRVFARAQVQAAIRGKTAKPVMDIVFVFGGWGSEEAGQPLPAGEETDTQRLVTRLREIQAPTGRSIFVQAYQGAMGEVNRAETEVFEFVRRNFHPLGKLVFYGYSVGGFSALRLCYRFGMSYQFYDVRAGMIGAYPPTDANLQAGGVYGFVRVDRLVVIDAASGPLSGVLSRRAWPCVRQCLNVYQTADSPVWSHGGPVEAFDPAATVVDNRDWTERFSQTPSRGHGQIDRESLDLAFETIRSEVEG